MSGVSESTFALLRLTLTPDLGPVMIARLLEKFGSAERVLGASPADLSRVKGIGEKTGTSIASGIRASEELANRELEAAARLNVRIIAKGEPGYPALLAQLADSPPVLYVRGELLPGTVDRYPVAIVGARECTAYGMEQAERFGSVLAQAGLTVVSGGARGIDTAAHRGALRTAGAELNGRTVAVLGCGLAECYPPENQELFDRIVAGRGAIVSELPLYTPPKAENFPARNRIISGLSLGVIVIEAGERSGALITARVAAEDHGREVMALPGRVDSTASAGSLKLIKQGGAALVTSPGDVIELLELPARHHFAGTHADRYAMAASAEEGDGAGLFALSNGQPEGQSVDRASEKSAARDPAPTMPGGGGLRDRVLAALAEARTVDELLGDVGASVAEVRTQLTMLEIERRVVREGSRFRRSR